MRIRGVTEVWRDLFFLDHELELVGLHFFDKSGKTDHVHEEKPPDIVLHVAPVADELLFPEIDQKSLV